MLDEYLLNLWLLKMPTKNSKIYLSFLKVRSAPMDEWILHTMNIEKFENNTEYWVREAISKGMRRYQNAKYFNCVRMGHLRRDCGPGIMCPRNNISSGNGKNRRT